MTRQEKLLRFPIKRINCEEKRKETQFPPKQTKGGKKRELSIPFFRTIPSTYDVTTPANGVHCGARS